MTLHIPIPQTPQPFIRSVDWEVDESQIEYPSEDGLPMAESDHQRIPLIYGVESLDLYFKADPETYVSGNLLIYPEKGNPYESVSPDLFVVFGVEDRLRDSYKLWEEKQVPSFILEILSKSTASKDQGSKQGMYQFWGVQEYFIYDPKRAHIEPPLKGVRLGADGFYEIIDTEQLENDAISIYSETLGLEVRVFANGELRFYDPIARRYLPNYEEANQIAAEAREDAAEAREDAAEARKNAAEARKKAAQAQRAALKAEADAASARDEMEQLKAKLRAMGIDPNSI